MTRFIVENLLDDELAEGTDPLTVDAVDSLGLEQLASFIEREFGVALLGDEMSSKNLASVPALASLIDGKRQGVT